MRSVEVVLGVTGGIAAYKATEIVRELRRAGAEVTVIMTAAARRFITPLTLQTLSGRRGVASTFEPASTEAGAADVEHIGLARDCDLFLVAPATANVLAKMASGIADDFVTTFYLAVTCPVLVAPSMNTRMWEHPAVKENLDRLRDRGVHVLEPDVGPLAARGEGIGAGRLPDPKRIAELAMRVAAERRGSGTGLSGKMVLVTAGPTREALDPTRFLSNPSTGKMGFAVAVAARDLGAEVILVTGPTHLPDPPGIMTLHVDSAEEMRRAVMENLDRAAVVVKAAAVSDFRPALRLSSKAKKAAAPREMRLEPTPDILEEIGRAPGKRYLVGFAAETEHLARNAKRKLEEKNLDLVVANSVAEGNGDSAFGSDFNQVTLIDREGREDRWPRMSKAEVAVRLMSLVAGNLT